MAWTCSLGPAHVDFAILLLFFSSPSSDLPGVSSPLPWTQGLLLVPLQLRSLPKVARFTGSGVGMLPSPAGTEPLGFTPTVLCLLLEKSREKQERPSFEPLALLVCSPASACSGSALPVLCVTKPSASHRPGPAGLCQPVVVAHKLPDGRAPVTRELNPSNNSAFPSRLQRNDYGPSRK